MENNETERKTSPISLTKYLPLPTDQIQTFEVLTDTQIGFLIRLISKYYLGEKSFEEIKSEISNEDIIILPILINIKINIERAEEKYNKKREQNSKNGKKGGAPKGNQNARKKKDNEPPEEQPPEGFFDEDYEETINLMYKKIDSIQSNLSTHNTSLFEIFSKFEAEVFLELYIIDWLYSDTGKSNVEGWEDSDMAEFLNEVNHLGTHDFLINYIAKTKETYLKSSDDLNNKDWNRISIAYKRAASSAIEEYKNNRNNRAVD